MHKQDKGTMLLAVISVGFMATLIIVLATWIIAAWLFGYPPR